MSNDICPRVKWWEVVLFFWTKTVKIIIGSIKDGCSHHDITHCLLVYFSCWEKLGFAVRYGMSSSFSNYVLTLVPLPFSWSWSTQCPMGFLEEVFLQPQGQSPGGQEIECICMVVHWLQFSWKVCPALIPSEIIIAVVSNSNRTWYNIKTSHNYYHWFNIFKMFQDHCV